jgi:hypothetical protein
VTEQETSQSSAPRPIPDLGYFAGPAKPRGSSSFGSSFGGVPAQSPSGSPAPSRFTTPGVNQFGNAPTAPFGTVPPPAYEGVSPDPKPRSGLGISGLRGAGIIGTVVLLVVLGFFGFGRLGILAGFLAGDLKEPATLGGAQRVTPPAALASEAKTVERLEQENSGDAMAATYSDGTRFYSLIAQRVRIDVDEEFKRAGMGVAVQHVGKSTCAATTALALCLRTSRSLSVLVVTAGTPQQAAAAVDEAWAKL